MIDARINSVIDTVEDQWDTLQAVVGMSNEHLEMIKSAQAHLSALDKRSQLVEQHASQWTDLVVASLPSVCIKTYLGFLLY